MTNQRKVTRARSRGGKHARHATALENQYLRYFAPPPGDSEDWFEHPSAVRHVPSHASDGVGCVPMTELPTDAELERNSRRDPKNATVV